MILLLVVITIIVIEKYTNIFLSSNSKKYPHNFDCLIQILKKRFLLL